MLNLFYNADATFNMKVVQNYITFISVLILAGLYTRIQLIYTKKFVKFHNSCCTAYLNPVVRIECDSTDKNYLGKREEGNWFTLYA
jgi:hypothetical protein